MTDDGDELPDLSGLFAGLTGDGEDGGAGGLMGGLGGLLQQAQEAMSASQAASAQEVEGSSGGGMVRIRATGGGEVLAVTIAPEVVDPHDVEGLEDLVLAAVRDVNAKVTELHRSAMGGLAGVDPTSMLGGLLGGDDEREEE